MTTMLFPFNQLNADTKFAYAISETFKAMSKSKDPVLGSASDDFTILNFVEDNLQDDEIINYILHDETFPHNRFVECIFALHNSMELPYAQF